MVNFNFRRRERLNVKSENSSAPRVEYLALVLLSLSPSTLLCRSCKAQWGTFYSTFHHIDHDVEHWCAWEVQQQTQTQTEEHIKHTLLRSSIHSAGNFSSSFPSFLFLPLAVPSFPHEADLALLLDLHQDYDKL